ncbi:MAG: LD-carboxypeptidase [Clostridia bacterium]|nr:LD-carboxypeptidase [Clostridia bacterium]
MIPQKLKIGDEIRVIAPSRSLAIVNKEIFAKALDFLSIAGYKITFSKNAYELDDFSNSSSIKSRADDLHDAFLDPNVKAILTCIGGFNVNQILHHIDYNIIKENPKILCGYSDITALLNAVYAKTSLVTYHGPHFSTFGFDVQRDFTYNNFCNILQSNNGFELIPSDNQKYIVLQEGNCEGIAVGGNLCTLNLLQGTEFMPDLEDKILFIEDDNLVGKYFPMEFDRNLQSLLHCKGGDKVKAVIFGRFQEDSGIDENALRKIIKDKLSPGIPIIAGVDFGHVLPIATLPVGGKIKLSTNGNLAELLINL